MFIIWGTKRVERKQGTVADLCPICREIRSFQLVRVGLASHVYYLSFGEGKLAGHIIRCDACGVILNVEPARYASTAKDSYGGVELLVRDTFPNLREVCAERLQLEEQIRRTPGSFPPAERNRLLMEPFHLLNPLVEQRFANSTQMDRKSGLGCIGTVLVGGGLFFGSLAFQGPTQDKILISAAILFGAGTIYTFVQLHLGPGRFFRARVLAPLVKSQKPLQPTREEMAACIDRCKTLGLKIGKVAKPNELWARLELAVAGFDN
jgi:hypothetical protein